MNLNRRGFLGALAALAVAPKDLMRAPLASPFAGIDRSFKPLAITGLQAWLPTLTIAASVYCPKERIYLITNPDPPDGVSFMGVERGRPCVFTHPSGLGELREALDAAIARLSRDVERQAGVRWTG